MKSIIILFYKENLMNNLIDNKKVKIRSSTYFENADLVKDKSATIKIKTWFEEMRISSTKHPELNISEEKIDEEYEALLNNWILIKEQTLLKIKEKIEQNKVNIDLTCQDVLKIQGNSYVKKINAMIDSHYQYLINNFNTNKPIEEIKSLIKYCLLFPIIFNIFLQEFKEILHSLHNNKVQVNLMKRFWFHGKKECSVLKMKSKFWFILNIISVMTFETRVALFDLKWTKSWATYVSTLITAWKSEEIIVFWLNQYFWKNKDKIWKNIIASLNGWDSWRLIQSWASFNQKISWRPDILLKSDDWYTTYIELQNSRATFEDDNWVKMKVHKMRTSANCWTLIMVIFENYKLWSFSMLNVRREFATEYINDLKKLAYKIELPIYKEETNYNRLSYKLYLKDFEKSWIHQISENIPKEIITKIMRAFKYTTKFKLKNSTIKVKDLEQISKMKIH